LPAFPAQAVPEPGNWGANGSVVTPSAVTARWDNKDNPATSQVPRDETQALSHTAGKTYADIPPLIQNRYRTAFGADNGQGGLQMTVSQTTGLVNQAIKVSFSGGPKNAVIGGNQFKYVQVFQCWGAIGADGKPDPQASAPDPSTCQIGANSNPTDFMTQGSRGLFADPLLKGGDRETAANAPLVGIDAQDPVGCDLLEREVLLRRVPRPLALDHPGAALARDRDERHPLVIGGGLVGLVLVLVATFGRKMDNPAIVLAYAVAEGLFLGALSFMFTDIQFGGVGGSALIAQAVLGTFGVFFGMLVVYKTGAIRVTPRLTRMIIGALIGVVVLALGNLVASFFVDGGLGLRDGGTLAIIFSLVCIGIAAFSFLLDFDAADQLIRAQAPEKAAWGVAFGLTVTLVWLYVEILRLLSYFNND